MRPLGLLVRTRRVLLAVLLGAVCLAAQGCLGGDVLEGYRKMHVDPEQPCPSSSPSPTSLMKHHPPHVTHIGNKKAVHVKTSKRFPRVGSLRHW